MEISFINTYFVQSLKKIHIYLFIYYNFKQNEHFH